MAVKKDFKWPGKLKVIAWKNMAEDMAWSWGELLQTDTGMRLHVAGEYDTVDRFRWLGRLKLFEMTTSGPFDTSQMLQADGRYCVRDGGPFPIRILWSLSIANAGYFVRGDSRLKTPRDIKKGTRINKMDYVASTRVIDALLAWAGVKPEDIDWVSVRSPEDNYQAVVEGRSEVGMSLPASPTMFAAEKNPQGLNWLDLNSKVDPEGAKRFLKIVPLVTFRPMHVGVPSAKGHWGMVDETFEVTRADVDADFIYHLAKWFDENYTRFKDRHVVNQFRNRATLIEGLKHTFLPCHEGLVSYLKDIGVWTKANEIRQQENLALVDRYAAAYLECMRVADEKNIWVARESEDWVNFWTDYKRANLPPFRLFEDLPGIK